ncbi:substrate-binding periplasmic protein [Desulfosediminicola flagellatus]|uniref:substrate-binding periplasmic protein n=1 Tax=Desulfosediminicola flagellatus TaxID=2569541 RepID=UPI0010ACC466|nr:transporter substrate-binding domain-containing protein [Desulfosediminicola flagellatus]
MPSVKIRVLLVAIPILFLPLLIPGHIQSMPNVKIGVFECPPFLIKEANGSYSGLTILLLDELFIDSGSDYSIQEYTLQGLVEAVSTGEIDVGATCLSITPEREAIIDFSHSFYETHLAIGVKNQGYFTFFKNLITNRELLLILLAIAGSACVIGTIYYVFEHRINEKLYTETSTGRKLIEGFILGLLFVTKGPFNYYEFKTLTGRVMTVLLAIVTTFFIASITAVLASSFTIGSLSTDIRGPRDLITKKVGVIRTSTSSELLSKYNVVKQSYDSINELLEALDNGEVEAILADDAILKYYLKKEKAQDKYLDLSVLPYQFSKQNYGLALKDDSPFIEELNQRLLRIRKDPEWKQALMEYFGE